jgi:hypothetical protein
MTKREAKQRSRRKKVMVITSRTIAKGSLIRLARQINAEHLKIVRALKIGLKHAITAGSLLIAAKAKLKHGEWLPWLRDHCLISERTAQLYMRLAEHVPEMLSKSETVADLTVREAIALIAKIDEPDLTEDADNTNTAATTGTDTGRGDAITAAVTAIPATPPVLDVHQGDRPAFMSKANQHRANLNTAWGLLSETTKQPRMMFVGMVVRGTAAEARAFANFFNAFALAMKGNTVSTFDEVTEEDKTVADGRGATRPSAV